MKAGTKRMWLLTVAIAVVLIAVVACREDEAEEPAAPAPAVAPAPAAPGAVPAPAPVAAPIRAAVVPGECYIQGGKVTDCPGRSPHTYKPPVVAQGQFPSNYYEGPMPTKFYESPMAYQLVKAGKLPPLEERLPEAQDVLVVQPAYEIGEYGGTWRVQTMKTWTEMNRKGGWALRDTDGLTLIPEVGKSFEVSSDGRTWTMKLRRGSKWSDGQPFTMEDIRFAWDDHNFNTEMNKSVDIKYKDAVTGNPAKFDVLDDYTWSLTYDTPVFSLFEGRAQRGMWCRGRGFCFFSPKHYMKQFHPKYADPAKLQQLISDGEFDDWTQLWKKKTALAGDGAAGEELPRMAVMVVNPGITSEFLGMVRNHYYVGVDPEGNQLPYVDDWAQFIFPSREAAVFRSMLGETDSYTNIYHLQELPMYNALKEKGDFRIYHWPSPSGADGNIGMNQTYNEDPEIGRWMRTHDFRRALSLATDREELNEVIFLGLGSPQNWVPHPDTPFYPGAEWATLDAVRDVAKANRLLDDLGLTSKDAGGFRMRLDGKGPLALHFAVEEPTQLTVAGPVAELLTGQWAEIGIKVTYKSYAGYNSDIRSGKEYLGFGGDLYQSNPWMQSGGALIPWAAGNDIAPLIGEWHETEGESGMAPTGPDPAWLPLAPEGNFPADPTGKLKELIDLKTEGFKYALYDPKRIEIGQKIFEISADQKFNVGTVGFSGHFRGIMIARNNLLNVHETHATDVHGFWSQHTYFFDGGRDNLHNE